MKATDIGKYLWRIFVILLLKKKNILVIVMVSGYEPFASFASQGASEAPLRRFFPNTAAPKARRFARFKPS